MPSDASTKEPTRRAFSTSSPASSSTGCGGIGSVDRVAGEALVDHAADDAHHRRAAVVALNVELPLLAGEARHVVVPDPDGALPDVGAVGDVTQGLAQVLRDDRVVEERDDQDDLEPREVGRAAHEAIVPPGISENLMSSAKER